MKDLTIKLWVYQTFSAFINVSTLQFRYHIDFRGRFNKPLPGPKIYATPPLIVNMGILYCVYL